MAERKDDRSLGELFSELAQETSTLVRQELRFAGQDMSLRVSKVGKDLGIAAAGCILLHTSFLVIVAVALIILADLGLDWWLAGLIVAIVLAIVGYALLKRATVALKRADILPQRTIEHLKEDREWVKEQVG